MKYLLVALAVISSLTMWPALGSAQATDQYEAVSGPYKAGIWIDPDGCEHWVLDFGIEGMMSPHLDREGRPVCGRRSNICIEFAGDTLFQTAGAEISVDMVERLTNFFMQSIIDGRPYFTIVGHTDNIGSDQYNYDLGLARARAVAAVADRTGAVTRTETMGEKSPIASNDTEDGRRRNRRVEIMCN